MNKTKSEPQMISRYGVNEAVVISIEKYKELCGLNDSLVSFFRASPLYGYS